LEGVALFGTFLPLSLIANAFYQAEQPKGIYSWGEALSFCRAGAAFLLGFGLLFLKMVTDVGICYVALGLVLVYISTRLKSKQYRPSPVRDP
jgi:O-antigen/teichoic acid export membrane protein